MTRKGVKRRATPRHQNRELIVRRLKLGMSPNDLARRAGLSGNTVRSAESGEYVEPRSQAAIASALGVDDPLTVFPFERQREAA
jgi:lambda repressor-like predicted transcriptional regulator